MRRCVGVLVIVLAAAGCGTPTPPPVAASGGLPTPATEYLVKEARIVNGMVSVRADIPVAPPGRKPAVVALFKDTHQLVGAGFVAVTYQVDWARLRGPAPTPAPGSVGTWVLASPSAAVLGEAYLHDVARNAEIVSAVLDWMQTLPEVDMARVGMAGGSTNGFITLRAVAAEPRLHAAVAIAACGDYHGFLRDSSMGIPGQALALAPAYEEWLRTQEVVRHPDRLVHAALLMVNRVGDRLIPVGCADETARVLREAYARAGAAERFEYLRLESEGHGMSAVEVQAMFDWLRRWLQPAT